MMVVALSTMVMLPPGVVMGMRGNGRREDRASRLPNQAPRRPTLPLFLPVLGTERPDRGPGPPHLRVPPGSQLGFQFFPVVGGAAGVEDPPAFHPRADVTVQELEERP